MVKKTKLGYLEYERILEKIEGLHIDIGEGYCTACDASFPCPTIQIIEKGRRNREQG